MNMVPGLYWFWPERGQEFTTHGWPGSWVFKPKPRGENPPLILRVFKWRSDGTLFALPSIEEWPEEGEPLQPLRVDLLPGIWVRLPDPPKDPESFSHWKTGTRNSVG